MKRTALVAYESSDDDEQDEIPPQPVKKRKLPTLSSSLIVPAPKDDPTLHQGRIRATPHVDGQWAAHIYVSIKLSRRSALYTLIQKAFERARETVPTLRDIWDLRFSNESQKDELRKTLELHVSLSRPIFLRAHQREEFKQAIRLLARNISPFKISFATFSVLENDEKTRTFLALDVGAGHHELKALVDGMTPTLRALRQNEYYSDPKFHASIAWALLDKSSESLEATKTTQEAIFTKSGATQFPTIPCIPERLITQLNEEFTVDLRSKSVGVLDIHDVNVKVGKEVSTFRLRS
ncbi:hypothetical protein K435DRAFT_752217 [Dendrothele bispora CBS 962.96]|uniref:U6 snRNA phosphodiesterase n=1 Tax=Dendrothele bispora (strain CBS 962.96) TaxID=1314807 RepID=A0A4S8MAB3_DENBC|nr:hypothetical protein K435DRAFT_752217 [Dendrothele bispora CBS 962.96]